MLTVGVVFSHNPNVGVLTRRKRRMNGTQGDTKQYHFKSTVKRKLDVTLTSFVHGSSSELNGKREAGSVDGGTAQTRTRTQTFVKCANTRGANHIGKVEEKRGKQRCLSEHTTR